MHSNGARDNLGPALQTFDMWGFQVPGYLWLANSPIFSRYIDSSILKEVVNLSYCYREWAENPTAERIRAWLSPLESESGLADILAK